MAFVRALPRPWASQGLRAAPASTRNAPLANRCCMCCCNEESLNHLLLHCPVAHSLWAQMLQVLGSNGSCQVQWRVWCFVGVIGWGNFLWTFGIWFLIVWCGLFGWKKISTLLRLKRNRLFIFFDKLEIACLVISSLPKYSFWMG